MLNIYLNYLFYFLFCDVCNFADNITSYVRDKNLAFLLAKLEGHSNISMKWFENNYMKMNSDRCHLFISGNKIEHLWDKIANDRIWGSKTVKLLLKHFLNLNFNTTLSHGCFIVEVQTIEQTI